MQNLFSLILIILFFNGLVSCKSIKEQSITSPDGNLIVSFRIENTLKGKRVPVYCVKYKGHSVIDESRLGMVLGNNDTLLNNLIIREVLLSEKNEEYPVDFGKTKTAVNNYKEMDICLGESGSLKRSLHIVFRAFNDGIAFRYQFPRQTELTDFLVTDELTTFLFNENPRVYYTAFDNYTNSHEALYSEKLLSEIPPEPALIDMPATFKLSDNLYAAITEADVRNYPGMYLIKGKGEDKTLFGALSPLPGQTEVKARLSAPARSPWRVIMIADKIGKLIESNLINNLCEPSENVDISWIKTGKTTWPWWNGTIAKNVDFKVGVNTATTKYYIDFAAKNGIAFHAISDENGIAWYGPSRGSEVANQDVTTPIPDLDMPEILRYAKEKGVGIRFWVHYGALQKRIDSAFALYGKWGINGLMVDFLDRDDQEIMNYMEEVLQKAAKNHVKIQFHGAPKPTGLKRIYPNLTNTEGVLNLEYLKWSDKCSPAHNVMIPFTRMLAGPLDYHLGGFRSVTREEFAKRFPEDPSGKRNRLNNSAPVVMGTRAHHMALYVVFENPEPMICDYPDAYKNQTGFEFVLKVPTVWDDIKVINAEVGEFITIARKKGNDWYIGSITNWTSRDLKIPLDFLSPGDYEAEIYSDTPETVKDPNVVSLSKSIVSSKDIIKANLVTGGGHVIHLKPNSDGK
jgi:alpha-glucosidase